MEKDSKIESINFIKSLNVPFYMVNGEILNYLKSGIESGMNIEELKKNLISTGWEEKEVLLAINEINNPSENKDNAPKNYIPVTDKKETKKIFSKKLIIITICIFLFIIILIFALNFSSGTETSAQKAIDIKNGTHIEFTNKNEYININNKIETFKILNVGEYIVKYKLGEFNGELFMKENTSIDSNGDGLDDILLRLEEVKDKVPKIFISKVE